MVMRTVSGRLELPRTLTLERPARALIRVEDVSRADAAALTLGESVLEPITSADVERGFVAFTIGVQDPDPGASCSVRAHLDVDGDETVSRGDYVSTEHVAVLGTDAAAEVRVPLRRVE
jgi:hypothetical protein